MKIQATMGTQLDSDAGVERDANGDVIGFRLFRAGRSETDYGPTLFDERAANDVMAIYRTRGNRLALDFDHASLDKSATVEQRRAAGSFDLEVRGGELWAVDVRLTEEARSYVRAGQYLSVSPAWQQDEKTGRPVEVINCALTVNPATHGAVMLAASRTHERNANMKTNVQTIYATARAEALRGDRESARFCEEIVKSGILTPKRETEIHSRGCVRVYPAGAK